MASSRNYTLLLFLLIAGIADAGNFSILDHALAKTHERWMADHGRVYKDDAEKARRFEIFKENVKYIDDFNSAGEHKYTLGLGPFADLTNEEFLATYTGGLKVPDSEIEVEAEESRRSFKYETAKSRLDVASSFDWRTKNAVTPVKFQGQCGSCWSFAVAATVESLTYITKGILYNLSTQQLIDCDKNNNGCAGGWTGTAYEYVIRRPGLTTEENYPFKGVKGPCKYAKEAQAVADINGYKYVPRNDEQALKSAVTQQPVSVAIDASRIKHYMSGVFHGPCGTNVNHAVVIVGYGEEDDGTKYWTVKNSWGSWWGEDGYIRMERDSTSKGGICGIALWGNYPTA